MFLLKEIAFIHLLLFLSLVQYENIKITYALNMSFQHQCRYRHIFDNGVFIPSKLMNISNEKNSCFRYLLLPQVKDVKGENYTRDGHPSLCHG